jgi:hypothetical protein
MTSKMTSAEAFESLAVVVAEDLLMLPAPRFRNGLRDLDAEFRKTTWIVHSLHGQNELVKLAGLCFPVSS